MIVKRMVMSMANKLNEDDYDVDSFLTWVHDDIVYDSANDLGVGQALKGKNAVAEWYTKYKEEFPKRKMDVWNICFASWPLSLKNVVTLQWSIVETDKQCTTWQQEIAPKTGIFDQLLSLCKSLNLFPWIDDVNHIRTRVLEDIFGMHPMALSSLLNLSSEIGSDARSTFTFFSGDVGGEKGSYADFIKDADMTMAGGKLRLYTVDQLFTFFRNERKLTIYSLF